MALIAACVCLLLVGTAFAANPQLRSLIWGNWAPYAQDIDQEGSVAVYDGMEIRLVSALADSRVARLVFEVWDMEGDRLTQLANTQMPNTNGWNGLEWDVYAAQHYTECSVQILDHGRWDLLSFDPDTGVARFQGRIYLVDDTEEFDAQIQIEAGAFDTQGTLLFEQSDATWDDVQFGWTLSAHITTVPMRGIAVDSEVSVYTSPGTVTIEHPDGRVEVYESGGFVPFHIEQVEMSQISIAIHYQVPEYHAKVLNYSLWHSALLELADGTTIDLEQVFEWNDEYGSGSIALHPEDCYGGDGFAGYFFREPIDPDQVVGLQLEGVYIPLK